MKFLFSEYNPDYSHYRYPYQVYMLEESQEEVEYLYAMGALPTRIHEKLYLVSRSVRVDLAKFELSSENRRILKKSEDIEVEFQKLSDFKYDFKIGKLAKDFYSKFGEKTMSAQKIKWVYTSGGFNETAIVKDKSSEKIIGYCALKSTDFLTHYAYPFYELEHPNKSLGITMMLKSLILAKEQGKTHFYLGTCYTESALYKLQFKGVEYFNGIGWSDDLKELKDLVRGEQSDKDHLFEKINGKKELIERVLAGQA